MRPSSFNLDRFLTAQVDTFDAALAELRAGRKRTHWMWFTFPQMHGLGMSAMAERYGIVSLDEARAYLAHPVLGKRLRLCAEAVLQVEGRTLHEIFGSPDDLKFSSSMTLFALAEGAPDSIFHQALDRYCDGRMDRRTLDLLDIPSA
jgi:uncharacterized protein (DUF1810 family)